VRQRDGKLSRRRYAAGSIVLAGGLLLAALGSAGVAGASAAPHKKSPVLIGVSLSLSGDNAAYGQAFKQGYELWADYQNSHGGLLGHPVQLKILSDASSLTQLVTNYETLITLDHVQLILGPFSTLFTVPTEKVAHRFGYALIDGAGGKECRWGKLMGVTCDDSPLGPDDRADGTFGSNLGCLVEDHGVERSSEGKNLGHDEGAHGPAWFEGAQDMWCLFEELAHRQVLAFLRRLPSDKARLLGVGIAHRNNVLSHRSADAGRGGGDVLDVGLTKFCDDPAVDLPVEGADLGIGDGDRIEH